MPNIQSAKKRVKIIETKTLRNQILRSSLKTFLKKFEAAIESADKKVAAEAYKTAVKKMDQAVSKGILHKNTAARRKSQMTLKLNKLA